MIYINGDFIGEINQGEVLAHQINDGDVISSNNQIFGLVRSGSAGISLTPEVASGTKFSIANHRRDLMRVDMVCVSNQGCNVFIDHPLGNDENITISPNSYYSY